MTIFRALGEGELYRYADYGDGPASGVGVRARSFDEDGYRPSGATIGYLGVVPEHRGHHYSDDLVIEARHVFTEAGETVANDATDVGNAPMAASFARCRYRVTGRRCVFV